MCSVDLPANLTLAPGAKTPSSAAELASTEKGATKRGCRVDALEVGEAVLDSGDYREGFCHCAGSVMPGTYTLIVSAYYEGKPGSFIAKVACSTEDFKIVELPAEGAGMGTKSITGKWSRADGSAAGCSNHNQFMKNPFYVFQVDEVAAAAQPRLTARLQIGSDCTDIPVNLSLFRLGSALPDDNARALLDGYSTVLNEACRSAGLHGGRAFVPKRASASSLGGVYSDRPTGGAVHDVPIGEGMWALVPSSFDPMDASYRLDVHCSSGRALQTLRGPLSGSLSDRK